MEQFIKLVCENPVKNFWNQKQRITSKKDIDADLTIVDMNMKKVKIKNENMDSKCKWSPFNGMDFQGTPVATMVNGQVKMKNGKILGNPLGKSLLFNA